MKVTRYFGASDAAQEDPKKLSDYFYDPGLLENLKIQGRSQGQCVVVGVRGSGKTAICRVLETRANHKGIGWKLSLSDGFPVNHDGKPSAYYSSLLTVYLLTHVVNQVRRNKDKFTAKAVKALPNIFQDIKNSLAHALTHTKFKLDLGGPGLEFDVNDLLKEGQRELSQVGVDEFRDKLSPCLSERTGYIFIDDVDDIFPGSDVNYEFIEGLIAAAARINDAFGQRLHCLVFLKAGPYHRYYEHGSNYPKYAHTATVICWHRDDLISMLAARSRIAAKQGKAIEDPVKSLQYSFEGNKAQIQAIQSFILSRCNSGPRDIIDFANLAKETAGLRKVNLDDLRNCEQQNSKNKLFDLNRDYEKQYGPISEWLAKIFRNKSSIYAKGQLEQLIQTQVLGNSEIKRAFGSMELVHYADATAIMEKLFQFGFIGFRDNPRTQFLYSIDTECEMVGPGDRLFDADQHQIHPAYTSYLRLHQSVQTRKPKSKSK